MIGNAGRMMLIGVQDGRGGGGGVPQGAHLDFPVWEVLAYEPCLVIHSGGDGVSGLYA
jgi:hypothetical protein